MQTHIYRHFRIEPSYQSPTTRRRTATPQGWRSPDLFLREAGYYAWWPTLDKARAQIDQMHALAEEGRGSHIQHLIKRLREVGEHAQAERYQALAAQHEAEKQKQRNAESEAANRAFALRRAAPDLLAALRAVLPYINAPIGYAEQAEAAIKKATEI